MLVAMRPPRSGDGWSVVEGLWPRLTGAGRDAPRCRSGCRVASRATVRVNVRMRVEQAPTLAVRGPPARDARRLHGGAYQRRARAGQVLGQSRVDVARPADVVAGVAVGRVEMQDVDVPPTPSWSCGCRV